MFSIHNLLLNWSFNSYVFYKIDFAFSVGYNLMRTTRDIVKQKFSFKGRVPRSEFWIFLGVNFFFSIYLFDFAYKAPSLIYIFLGHLLIIFIPALSITARRLHDVNKSAWWLLIYLIPLLGIFCLFIMLCFRGTKGTNFYGISPE